MDANDALGHVYLPCTRCGGQTDFEFSDLAGIETVGCGHCGAALDRALLGRIRIALRTDYVRRQRSAVARLKTAS